MNHQFVVIVDGLSSAATLAPSFRALGYACIHVLSSSSLPAGFISRLVESDYAMLLEHDSMGFDALVAKLRSLPVAHVLAGADSGALLADQLAEAMDIETRNDFSLSHARRNKFEMIETVRRHGLAAPHQQRVNKDQRATFTVQEPKFPLIVKPASSAGVDNVHVCRTAQEVEVAVDTVLSAQNIFGGHNSEALIQQYLIGKEYMVDTVSCDGHHKVIMIWRADRSTSSSPFAIKAELIAPDATEYAALFSYTSRLLDALGIRWGAAHTEVMLTGEGPVVIEVNPRLHGSLLNSVPSSALGTNHALECARAYAAPANFLRDLNTPIEPSMHCMKAYLVQSETGVLRRLPNWHLIESLPSFQGLYSRYSPGKAIRPTTDLATSPGIVFLASDSRECLDKDYAEIRKLEAADLYADML